MSKEMDTNKLSSLIKYCGIDKYGLKRAFNEAVNIQKWVFGVAEGDI